MNPVLPHLQQIRTTLLELAHVGKNDVHHDPVATSFVTQRNFLKMKPEIAHIDRDNPHVGIQESTPDSSLRVPVSNRRRHRHEERIVQRSMLSVLMNQQQKEEEDSQQSHEASTASTQQRQHERSLHNSGSSAPQSCLGKSHQPRSPPPKIDVPVPGVPMPRRMRSAVNVMQQRHRTLEDEMMERLQQVKMMELSNTNDSSSSNGGGGGGIGGGYCSRGGQSSNEARKSRRAQHHRAIIHDLTEIVSDLFLAESKLVNPSLYGVQPDHDLRLQREQVSKCVQDFILSLPPRYALGVESPSEVLIHMRLMAAVRADPSRPTVHIANLDDDAHWMSASSSIATTFKAESESASGKLHTNNSQRKRLVTICCTDQHGLLEYISRILATSGSRVLDADVMLSSDSIALDRFVVEMNGRLRLDRLAQYVGEFLEQQKEKKGLQTSEQIKEGDAFPDASEPVAKPDLPGSLYFRHNSILPVRRCLSSMDIVRGIPLRQALKEQTGSSRNLLSSLDSNESFVPLTRSQTMLPTSSTSNNKFVPTTSRLLTKSEISAKVQEMTADPGLDDIRGSVSSETSNPPDDNSNEKVQIRPLIKRRGISDFDAVGPFRLTEALKNDASHNPATKGLEKRNIPMIPFDELMLIETLGVGRVSTIYRAAWRPNPQSADGSEDVQMLALKVAMVNPETHDTSHINELHREFEIAACLQHPNISHLVGIAEDHDCFCLAYEYCEGGSLLSLVSDRQRCYEYLPIAMDIVQGLAYLHANNIVHRDVKLSNILLDRNNRARISDFGMSVAMSGQELTAETGTYRYMAPEVIRHESYSSLADVYSFGICLWQLITREIPFATMTPIQAAFRVANGERPPIPKGTPSRLKDIIVACWEQDSRKRPSFTWIAMALYDYATTAFSPATVSAQTLQIANDMIATVEGNSTVNVDFSAPISTNTGAIFRDDYDGEDDNVGLEL